MGLSSFSVWFMIFGVTALTLWYGNILVTAGELSGGKVFTVKLFMCTVSILQFWSIILLPYALQINIIQKSLSEWIIKHYFISGISSSTVWFNVIRSFKSGHGIYL